MKKKCYAFVVLISMLFTSLVNAQKFSGIDKSPMDVAVFPSSHRISEKLVKVYYSRPQLKGREFSKLVPQGEVWRTGANEAVEVVFYKDVLFGGKLVKSGRYTLFTIPKAKDWTVILSTAENVWGAYSYKDSEDVVRVKGLLSTIKKPIEVFSICFDGKPNDFAMYFGWENTVVSVPIKIKE